MPLTAAGLELETVEELIDQIEEDQRGALGEDVETGPATPLGQLTAIVASALEDNRDLAQGVYASFDPESATGDALERVCALTGTIRRDATPSIVEVTVTASGGTSIAAGALVLAVAGSSPLRRFASLDPVENPGVGNLAVSATFRSEETGPVEAPAGSLTVLAEPAAGFVSSTNPADAELGLLRETDVELRARRRAELARAGSATVDAIRVDVLDAILDAEGVRLLRDVVVFENVTDETDLDGLPPHSIEVLAYDGTPGGTLVPDQDIADAVWATKPGGIRSYGMTSATVLDARGDLRSVQFSRPTAVPVEVEVTIATGPEYAASVADAISEAVAAYADAEVGVGQDLVLSRLYCAIFAAGRVPEEISSITLIRASRDGDPLAAADVQVATRELITVDVADVTVLTV